MFVDYDSEAGGEKKNTKYNLHSAHSDAKTGFHLSSRSIFAIDLKIFGSIMANSEKNLKCIFNTFAFY